MAATAWTINTTGYGVVDHLVFISSQGEVVMYSGSDPSSATAWTIAGMFRIGRPIGRRCFQKIGGDVVLITADGAYPLSKALRSDDTQPSEAITDKIANLINSDVQSYGNNFGWQPILYPIGNKVLINVPYQENAVCYQYVSNPRMSKDMEQKLWKSVVSFASDMVEAYLRFVQAEYSDLGEVDDWCEAVDAQ